MLRFPRGDDDDDDDVEDQLMSTRVDQSLTDIGQRFEGARFACYPGVNEGGADTVLAATHGFICSASDISRRKEKIWTGFIPLFLLRSMYSRCE